MRTMLVLAVLVAVGSAGCVAKSKYVELENQLENCREKNRGGGEGRRGTGDRAELIQQLQPLVQKGILEVEDIDGRTVIGMRAEVLFPSGSADLSASGKETIREVGGILARRTDLNWQIEGHTDNEPISTAEFPDNWHLGAARAMAVLRVLINAGMDPNHVSAATFGQYAPVASNTSDSGKAMNRRIEIVLLPEIRRRRG
jgi:chemotaxis protein MotB